MISNFQIQRNADPAISKQQPNHSTVLYLAFTLVKALCIKLQFPCAIVTNEITQIHF